MTKTKRNTLNVNGSNISFINFNEQDYICLTDMVKNFEGSKSLIGNWISRKDTIEFLGIWERLYNENFKLLKFEEFKNSSGTNRFSLSPQKWIETTNAIGIISKSGKYGGTYAHKDIAFEFGTWLNPEFKLLLIKEFQRLKELEQGQLQWDYRRFLSKVNYTLHTDAIKENIIPNYNFPKGKDGFIYAGEADVLNLALFGCTAQQWREKNPKLISQGNIRDFATVEQLTVLSNLESLNATYIAEGLNKEQRFYKLQAIAKKQLQSFMNRRIAAPALESSNVEINIPFDETIQRIAQVKPPKKD